jgi:hypothetical protein
LARHLPAEHVRAQGDIPALPRDGVGAPLALQIGNRNFGANRLLLITPTRRDCHLIDEGFQSLFLKNNGGLLIFGLEDAMSNH